MVAFKPGQHVLVNISAGIVPGAEGSPDWEPGTIEELLPSGLFRVRLEEQIGGRPAVKEAAPEHLRPLA